MRSPGGVNAAYRRIYSRRERIYNRNHPDVVAERLDMAEESPMSPSYRARERAETHISYAYVVAGYAHSSLIAICCIALAICVVLFAQGVLADVSRKIRVREDNIVLKAASCRNDRLKNGCELLEDGSISHATPALLKLCEEWLACEKRGDFAGVDANSGSVWSETIADIVNAFTSRISSMTTMIGVLVLLLGTFAVTTASFGFFHNKYVATNQRQRDHAHTPAVLDRDDNVFLTPRSCLRTGQPARIGTAGTPRALTYDEQSPGPGREKTT